MWHMGNNSRFLADEDFRLSLSISWMPVSSRRVRFLLHRPCYTLVRWMLGMRIIWRLLAPFAFRVYPLRLYASYVRLQPPWPTVDCRLCKLSLQLVSSVGLYNMFLQHHAFLLGAGWRRLVKACVCLQFWGCGQPRVTEYKTRTTLCEVGWFCSGCFRLTRSLAIWCQGSSASSVGVFAQ